MLRVLVDADNVSRRRAQPVINMLEHYVEDIRLTASGKLRAIRRMSWPRSAELIVRSGWQKADAALADSYRPSDDPLVLISGDGDFALLAMRHPGPVLVISGAASMHLHDAATVIDPAVEGLVPIRGWLRAHGVLPESESDD